MKVFFNPSYTNFVYQNLEDNPLHFDQKVCNTEALIDLLELHAGIHSVTYDEVQRSLEYCKAMTTYLEKNSNSIFSNSFKVDAYNTAKQCLAWRDAFLLSGWNGEGHTGSERLDELSEIEKYFDCPSSYDRLKRLIKEINNNCHLPSDLEIITPFKYTCFNPLLIDLFESLKNKGVTVTVQDNLPEGNSYLRLMKRTLLDFENNILDLRKSDGSVEVWLFNEKQDALRYLSQLEDNSFNVWINRDNKSLDNYLSFSGKPTCGSEDSGVTVLGSLPFIVLKLLERPLNLTSVVSYLGISVSPFSSHFRKELQNTIISSGGYFNDACREVIAKASSEDQTAVKHFFPDINDTKTALDENYEYSKEYVEKYLLNVSDWLVRYLKTEQIVSGKRTQLEISKKICGYMISLLSLNNKDKFTYQELMLLFENLTTEVKTEVYPSEKGCRNLITSASNFAAVSGATIWCDFYNPEEEFLSTSFMYPSEKEFLAGKLWKEDDERTFNRYNTLLPFIYTDKKLVLVIIKKKGTSEVTKHPVIIRLMKNMGMDEHEFYEYLGTKDILSIKGISTNESESINNHKQGDNGLVHFTRTNLVSFRPTESFSSISTLIDNPFDYVMGKTCGFSKSGEAAMGEVYTTKGTVAHAIIEELFNPKHGGSPSDIQKQIDTRFEEVFDKTILEVGGILLQKENKGDTDVFKSLMRECVQRLHDFIEQNQLTVKACEQNHKDVILTDFTVCGIKFTGSIDMVLEDTSEEIVIFDFKYSCGFSKYENLIKENRSMQLELYNALIKKSLNKPDLNCRRAYVLLPDVKVITSFAFEGSTFYIRNERSTAELIKEIRNSYEYRKSQILRGEVEDGEGIPITSLDYYQNINDESTPLVPLGIDEETVQKEANKYSNFKAFKAGK